MMSSQPAGKTIPPRVNLSKKLFLQKNVAKFVSEAKDRVFLGPSR